LPRIGANFSWESGDLRSGDPVITKALPRITQVGVRKTSQSKIFAANYANRREFFLGSETAESARNKTKKQQARADLLFPSSN
jgi:hypothetical protein